MEDHKDYDIEHKKHTEEHRKHKTEHKDHNIEHKKHTEEHGEHKTEHKVHDTEHNVHNKEHKAHKTDHKEHKSPHRKDDGMSKEQIITILLSITLILSLVNVYSTWNLHNKFAELEPASVINTLPTQPPPAANSNTETTGGNANLDAFAQCVTDSGATLYAASWCPHCKDQKALFGDSLSIIDHQECADPDGGQTAVCTETGIEAYPTWIWGDGVKETGVKSLEAIATKTGCALP